MAETIYQQINRLESYIESQRYIVEARQSQADLEMITALNTVEEAIGQLIDVEFAEITAALEGNKAKAQTLKAQADVAKAAAESAIQIADALAVSADSNRENIVGEKDLNDAEDSLSYRQREKEQLERVSYDREFRGLSPITDNIGDEVTDELGTPILATATSFALLDTLVDTGVVLPVGVAGSLLNPLVTQSPIIII